MMIMLQGLWQAVCWALQRSNSERLCTNPSIRWQLSCMIVRRDVGKIHRWMCYMQMGSQQQKLGACGVVGCHRRSLLSITVLCQTIILRFIPMLIMM